MQRHAYTHKSRYYVDATLTGALNSNLTGNKENNVLRGNHGNNALRGGQGTDVAVFQGAQNEYTLTLSGEILIVIDQVQGRDGKDQLLEIEVLRFSDGDISCPEL